MIKWKIFCLPRTQHLPFWRTPVSRSLLHRKLSAIQNVGRLSIETTAFEDIRREPEEYTYNRIFGQWVGKYFMINNFCFRQFCYIKNNRVQTRIGKIHGKYLVMKNIKSTRCYKHNLKFLISFMFYDINTEEKLWNQNQMRMKKVILISS